MLAIGNYRLVLHPNVDPGALEAQLRGTDTAVQPQLTRITTSVVHRLLRRCEPGPEHRPTREYVWQLSVQLMADDVRYQFEENLERIQDAVKDHATVIGVEVFAAVEEEPEQTG